MGTYVGAGHTRRWLPRFSRWPRKAAGHEAARFLCGRERRHHCFRNEWAHLSPRDIPEGGCRDPGGGKDRRPRMRRRDLFAVLGSGIVVSAIQAAAKKGGRA